ncbi:hypothetical protein DXG03_006146 [Asterophora parasitica]|uniref:Uncharacterized protein n=1 Tax=Asterophora parasitica TaxID=117018 RepID=A0A9P7KDM5_9AGAR|nr:hypothetical protein DXG03_006146 [Asterophora parasitica]
MATIDKDSTVSPQTTAKEGHGPATEILSGGGEEAQGVKSADDAAKSVVATVARTPAVSSELKPATTRPSLVQLGSGSTHSTTAQPKRFSAVNINKKFLEKNSSASASSPISQPAVKAGGSSLVRPQAQSAASHSRLVTTKLTSTSPASSASGAGWSRPSSAAPPNATGSHTPNDGSPPLVTTSLGATSSTTGAPQLPHAGKVIQPQPRAAIVSSQLSQKDNAPAGSNKTVWGNVKPTLAPKLPDVRNEFPTAAEVAQVASSLRTAKLNDSREAAQSAAASKQARMEEADTFRGVHLDPNAHHWDEMEEDDDNFLDGVIEFGDGRQYKIEPADDPSAESSLATADSNSSTDHHGHKARLDDNVPSKDPSSNAPVSKEERFADDFDRSWPRSRTSPAVSRDVPLPSSHPGPSHLPASPATSQDLHAQQEASRVLFNERSNRLEPYSNRPGSVQYASKRGSWQEPSSSPTEPRSARDFSSYGHNVQLLQKPGNQEPQSFRRFSNTSSSGGFGPGPSGTWGRDQLRRDGPPPSPRIPKDNFPLPGRDREDRGRRSDMGPPPLPAHAVRGPSRDGGRQLPPHLSQIPGGAASQEPRRTSGDSRFGPPSANSPAPRSARLPSQSPALSHTSAARVSPAIPISPLPNLSAPELDEARKDVMQTAAARAKQRRQQEEEEREKAQERARRKAAELEERIKATEAEKAQAKEKLEAEKLAKQKQEEEAIAVIEDAVKSVQVPKDSSEPRSTKLNLRRPPSLKRLSTSDSAKPSIAPRQTPLVPAGALSPTPATRAVKSESWRSKASPVPPVPTPQSRPPVPSFVPPPDHVESLVLEEDLEVVDFQDMAKYLGVPEDPEPAEVAEQLSSSAHPSRPVASDFFDSSPHPEPSISPAEELWRQKPLQDVFSERVAPPHRDADATASSRRQSPQSPEASRPIFTVAPFAGPALGPASDQTFSTLPTKPSPTSTDLAQAVVLSPQPNTVRTPRSNQSFYKEAAMSALDDAMSRIKGALDGMAGESKEVPTLAPSAELDTSKTGLGSPFGRLNSQKDRWVPPALRPRSFDTEPCEVFDVTCCERPRSPKPAWNAFTVRLPSVSRLLEPINKRQLQSATKPSYPVRMDILSFDPPVEGMKPRDLSVNDVLFRKPIGGFRTTMKYRVMLPRFRSGPRVNLPAHPPPSKANGVGAFGRPAGADGMATWRKPAQPKQGLDDASDNEEPGLATTSRSPPPDTIASGASNVASIPVSESSTPTKSDGTPARSRALKMPAGSAVAFYRDSRVDAVEEDPKPLVNFIVGSELESRLASQAAAAAAGKPQPSITITSPIALTSTLDSARNGKLMLANGLKESSPTENAPSLVLSKSDSKSSDDSGNGVPVTPPPHHAAPWARSSLTTIPLKESPARGPDPEHLKAVWSQTSNKAGSHGVNSLEGIADDLTSLPFTLQEVKSEDGETPPPSVSAPPSRMSLHDVTRAFQQVPPSSSSNPSPSRRTPPATVTPVRPPNYAYGLPPPPAGTLRPGYHYPSPVVSHSPSPLMYPQMLSASPAPGRMPLNGHAPIYGQPMWLPMPAGSNPQNHASIMRPMGSPYPPQMMPYSPGPPMYGHQPPASIQNPQQQPNGVQGNRDRNMTMMSPVMGHTAMYGSPVLMHAPVMPAPAPPNHGYMVPAGRGQTRTDNGSIQNSQQSNHHHQHHQTHSGYNSSSSFVRPTW